MTALALLAAVAAMLANSAASLLEASGTRRAVGGTPVWRQPRYLAGLAIDGVGWLLSVIALRVLPVYAVQSVLAGTVAVTAVAAHGGDPRRLGRRERAAVAAVVAGLVLVAASAAPGRPDRLPAAAVPVLLATTAVLVVALPAVLRSGRSLLMTILAGCAYGAVALSVRALHVASSAWGSVRDLLAEPLAYAVLGLGAVGTVLLARAMRHGRVDTVVGVLAVTEVVVPGLVGLVLLGDRVRPGWALVLAAGWALTLAGVSLLARSPAAVRH
ncbi:hypothetical protein ACI79C_14220 [Geodermatophilus sp. SYSU D00697]